MTQNPAPSKFHRKHYFIDRKFQGRYMLTYFIPMIVMLAFMLCTLYFASLTIVDTTTRILERDIENTIAMQLQDQESPSIERYKTAVNDVGKYIKTFSRSKELKHEMLSTILWVFGAGLFLVIIQIVFMTIFFSHRIAGPVYRFECSCHDMIEGRYASQIKLRKGDDLTNLAGLFNTAMASTRQRFVDLCNADSDEKRKEIASKLEL
jgi:nitrate/nitrite-specific signal transduction histidine kinase